MLRSYPVRTCTAVALPLRLATAEQLAAAQDWAMGQAQGQGAPPRRETFDFL
ncbi:MAG: hypothetical protein RJA70_4717 [Pseudomonadota bacterium]|jgi:hypothetical protein